MSLPMPSNNPFLSFPFGAINMECDARDLIVEGEIPHELDGTLYRAGPNPRFSPRGDYHLFAGDGMVHAFHLKEGKADYQNRWVRTAKFNLEDKEGRAVINAMNPLDCEPAYSDFALTDKEGLANTATVWHGGRLLVMEEAHRPYEIDPHTLDSVGSWDFRGKLHTAMTAHPKIDPETGEMIMFAYMATGPFSADVMIHKVDKDGLLTHSIHVPTPYCAMVHDFVVTQNYIVIPVMPITGSLERAMEGAPAFAWEPDKGVHIGILPRTSDSADDIRWVEMDLGFAFHFMNGYDQNGVITIDCCQSKAAPLFPTPDGKVTGKKQPFLHRWSVDLNDENARCSFTQIDEHESEFPQCDPRFAGKPYRHGWYASCNGEQKSLLWDNDNHFNVVGHYDHKTKAEDRFSCGKATVSEPIFVPASQDAVEGEGYLLCVVTSFETRTSSLFIFDSLAVANGPLAKVHLSHRIPAGFHGSWRSNSYPKRDFKKQTW